MATPSRLSKLGLSGKSGAEINISDPYIKTVEFPVDAIASGSAQDTGVPTPSKSMQVISSYIEINTAEATGTVKTVDIGINGQGNVIQAGTSVAAAGAAGAPVQGAISVSSSTNFTFTLGSADFAELDATCVVTFQGIDA